MGAGKVTGKLYDLDFEGRMTAGPVGVPLGAATIRAKGLDDVMKALQAAPPEMGGTGHRRHHRRQGHGEDRSRWQPELEN